MKEYIRNYIFDRLDGMKDRNIYIGDFSNYLYESDNVTGSITCNSKESQENLMEYREYFEHVVAYYKENFGEQSAGQLALDLMSRPETAECFLVFTYVDAILNNFLGSHKYKGKDIWDERMTIDQDFIDWIREHLDEAIDEGFEDMEEYNL